jgi:bifunctional non-homologous end joining protein LigD
MVPEAKDRAAILIIYHHSATIVQHSSKSAITADLKRLGAPRMEIDFAQVAVMKPETAERPFSRPGWVFELKYDGFRALVERKSGEARISYRSGRGVTAIFPEIAEAVAALPFDLILDGEIVIVDGNGHPDFNALQRRAQRTRQIDVARAAAAAPATFFAFDLLALDGFDLRKLPLATRKDLLRRVLALENPGGLRYIDEVAERGEDLFAAVAQLGLEGVVAKRADSTYRGGYSSDWLKFRVDRTADLAVLGFEPAGQNGFRCLHLGVRQGSGWAHAGTVGTGFDRQEMAEIRGRLDTARSPRSSVAGAPRGRVVWVEPELVCEVRYKEWTPGGHLRHPVFLRLREDKAPEECLPPADARGITPTPGPSPAERERGEGREEDRELPESEGGRESPSPAPRGRGQGWGLKLTNLDKVFWPDEGYTKGDLIEYYRTVSPWMLPLLRDRPLVLDRYPNGITGKSFFQKHAPDMAAARLRTVPIRAEGTKEIDYFLCEQPDDLLFLVNLGAIPFHIWSSRLPELDKPDWCILDLDPKGAPFADVVRIALAIRELCEEIEMPSRIKTSGGSGLHILLPMGRQLDHERVRQLGELLARVIVERLPGIATTLRSIPARKGRVYVDALQNGRGKLLAAPYSVRPHPGAPVSTPLSWSEVGPRLDVKKLNIRSVPRRLQKLKEDLLGDILENRPDLARSLTLLSERM